MPIIQRAFARLPLLLILPAAAQDIALNVDQIVQKHIAALGGSSRIQAIETVTITGGAILMGGQMGAPVLIRIKRPGSMRMDMHIQERSFVESFDGTTAWMVNSMSGSNAPQKLSSEDASALGDADFIGGALLDYKTRGSSVELADQETIEGAPAYKLKVTKKSGLVEYVFLNATTFFPIKTMGTRKQLGQELEYESMPSNYKEVNGVMMPFTVRQKVNGKEAMELNITAIDVNKPIDDAIFRMPEK